MIAVRAFAPKLMRSHLADIIIPRPRGCRAAEAVLLWSGNCAVLSLQKPQECFMVQVFFQKSSYGLRAG